MCVFCEDNIFLSLTLQWICTELPGDSNNMNNVGLIAIVHTFQC